MKSADTNLIVRFLVRDEPAQVARARGYVERGIFVSDSVLMETEWVLRSGYSWPRDRITLALSSLIQIAGVRVASGSDLRWALDRYGAGADWADMLHLIASRGHDAFVTFDKSLPGDAGPATPIAIELSA